MGRSALWFEAVVHEEHYSFDGAPDAFELQVEGRSVSCMRSTAHKLIGAPIYPGCSNEQVCVKLARFFLRSPFLHYYWISVSMLFFIGLLQDAFLDESTDSTEST